MRSMRQKKLHHFCPPGNLMINDKYQGVTRWFLTTQTRVQFQCRNEINTGARFRQSTFLLIQ
jgi:hypothetical protein